MALSLRGLADPFEEMRRDMNRFYEMAFAHPGGLLKAEGGAFWSPRCDVKETENEFLIHAELPGVKKQDLKYDNYIHAAVAPERTLTTVVRIELDRGTLTLSGEKTSEKKQEGERYYRVERSYGKFSRSFPVGEQLDPNSIKANFRDGVLELTIPKPQQQSAPKKITVS
jgi:HSP20 family protein